MSMDAVIWEEVNHNPVKLLRRISPERLELLARDREFLNLFNSVIDAFQEYMNPESTWFSRTYPEHKDDLIAYFSAEFGLHESLPIYSGGLGILSGDHCKSASDLGLPFVGVGFLYPQGYFTQYIADDGTQEALYEKLDFYEAPVEAARDADGKEIIISVELPGRSVYARVWRIQVGRIPLYLLDTNVEQNAESDRELAARLYGGDHEIRIAQEVVLGIGGVRALRALGIYPSAYHMNEGHSAFLSLERVRELVQGQHLSFFEAQQVVSASSVFTTHTPVPAGNDAFTFDLVDKYFRTYWGQMGLDRIGFMNLARWQTPWGELFSMTVLALRFAAYANGVSKLHGRVARKMWSGLWPELPVEEVPITHITNGVHTGTWLSTELAALYDEYLGAENWRGQVAWRRGAYGWRCGRLVHLPQSRALSRGKGWRREIARFRGSDSRSGVGQHGFGATPRRRPEIYEFRRVRPDGFHDAQRVVVDGLSGHSPVGSEEGRTEGGRGRVVFRVERDRRESRHRLRRVHGLSLRS